MSPLLDSTLIVWAGEFGRLPIVQKGGTGRDHNPHAFTAWLAGGGAKGGTRGDHVVDHQYPQPGPGGSDTKIGSVEPL